MSSNKPSEMTVKALFDLLKYFGGIITIVASVFVSVDKALDKKIDSKLAEVYIYVDGKISTTYEYVDSKTADNSRYIEKSRIKNIVKQYNKLSKDPSDIKIVDIEDCMYDWDYISLSNKTPMLRKQYNEIFEWYEGQ